MNKPTTPEQLEELRRAVKLKRLQERNAEPLPGAARPKITPADRSADLPLSWGQQRFWFLSQLDDAATATYHLPIGLRLSGELNRPALRATLDRLLARHEVLRTCFESSNGVPLQRIGAADTAFTLQEQDLSALPASEQEAELDRIGTEEFGQAFDMLKGPLCRGRLLRLGEQEHILLITLHHIVSDAWSNSILVREVSALYTAFSTGQPDPLPALRVQYADYAQWQRNWLQGPVLQSQLDHWTGQLAGAPHLLELPTDRPRPAAQSYNGASVRVIVPPELSAGLRALARAQGATLFMTVLSAWSVLLARLSGQDDVVVGSPIANRQRAETDDLIGFFVNTLAFRVKMDDDPTVAQLLARVKATTLGAYQHQDLPFEQVVEALNPPRSLGHAPIFQTSLNVATAVESGDLALPGLRVAPLKQAVESTQCDLMLTLTDHGSEMRGSLIYAVDLFDTATIERMRGHFETLLASMVDNPDARISQLSVLNANERQQLLVAFNATGLAGAQERNLPQMFEAQVAARPQALALVHGAQRLSYAELNEQANRIAHYLRSLGVQADQRVALCATRGAHLVAALLGILKAGAAYVPLDPAYPEQRLAFMLGDSAPRVLLTLADLEAKLSVPAEVHGVPLFALDGEYGSTQLAEQSPHNPAAPAAGLAQLAYLIYTSGSTGMPKGVMVEHGGLANYLEWARRYYTGGQPCDSVVSSPVVFDATITSLYVPLISGGCMTLIDEGKELEGLEALLREGQACGVIKITPVHLSVLGQRLRDDGVVCPAQTFIVGGEAFPSATARLWQEVAPGSRLINEYGPTETVVGCSVYEFDAAAVVGDQVPIGKPIGNTQMYLLDRHMQPVAPGVIGEIYIGGAGVARGYLNRPELNAERFVQDPFSVRAAARLYKTGDLGRLLADGNLDYLGRNDFQVKVRGYRIELGEIETRLCQCDGVREAIVIAREDQPGDKRLVAYVIAEDGRIPCAQDLRSQLEQQLAEYMLPSAFVVLDHYPLTTNGKLDRNALRAPGREAMPGQQYIAPQGAIEVALAGIWQELLKVEKVGRNDDFFALGGHSLLAVLMTSRLRKSFSVEVALKQLFDAPTLSAVASLIEKAVQSEHSAIRPADRSQRLPLSWAQQRLWFLDQLDDAAGAAYNTPTGLRLKGELNEAALQATLDSLVARHESLRTRFVLEGDEPVQLIAPADIGFVLARHDLSTLDVPAQAQEVSRISTEEGNQAFDLASGPLVRGRLLRLSEDEHVLLLTVHHIVTDGWSTRVLVQEFSTLYAAYCAGQPDPLPALTIQYADYAVWQRGWLQGEELERQLGFWKAHLADAPPLLALPIDRPRPAVQSYQGGRVALRLPPDLIEGLQALSQRHGSSLFMTMLAGWAVLLARISGQDEVVVGTPIANRHRAETENLIGFFVNTLALRVSLDAALSVEQLLAQVKATTLAAYEHQDLPFEQVVEAIRPTRSMDHSPVFQAMLTMNNVPEAGELTLPGLTLSGIGHTHSAIHFDLHLTLTEVNDGISGSLSYASDLFDAATVERLAQQFQTLLAAMVAQPGQSVLRLPLLDGAARQQLVDDFNATTAALPPEQLLSTAFEAQVLAQPDALAVVYGDDSLSYAQLNMRANLVAQRLLAQGVRPDDCVALCVERSVEMLVGIVGIWKAGAAYVPMDPANPADRLAYLLADCAPVALLTQSGLRDRLPELSVPVFELDGAALRQGEAGNPDPAALGLTTNNLAYVIYTSGSTGAAKGVMVEHHSALNFWSVMRASTHEACPAQARIALNASFAFDMSLKGILQLLSGHCVHIVPQSVRADGAQFLAFLERHRIDAFDCTPSQLELLLAAGLLEEGSYQPGQVLIGGEAINAATWDKLRQAQAPAFFNMYGPTEATVDATIGRIRRDDLRAHIGRPVANARIYILDRLGQPVPVGVSGEIHIAGAGVARGYLQRPDLTAERFLAAPFAEGAGARLYRTGDVGRWLADGRIEYQGRNDFQVKLRGYRIELGEIEVALLACEGVREAVVLAREDAPGEKRLVAYLVGQDASTVQIGELRQHLATVLSEYMVPSAFVLLKQLPLTRNGKLDRRALPAPDQDALVKGEYEAPQGATEQAIAAIWQDLLGVQQVSRHDHFFDLGGHSLMAVQLISRLREAFDVEVDLRELFANATLLAFGKVVEGSRKAASPNIAPADRSLPLPLSWAQQRLWFLDQLDPAASAAYHMAAGFRLSGILDRDALLATFDCIVARHESLRTSFILQAGVAVQRIAAAETGFSLHQHDLTALHGHELQSAIDRIGTDEALAPFDLANGPLIRGRLLRLAEQEHILFITQHHIISDGWSIGVLVREVCALYAAFCQGQPDPLPPMALQYPDYAAWQRQWLQGEALQQQLTFWREHLHGAPALLTMPTDRARPARQSYAGETLGFKFDAVATAGLRALSQRHGTTLFMTMLAGWSLLLSRMSGQDDVVVGTPIANRQRGETEGLIGFFANTLALRVRLEDDPTVAAVLAQVKASTLDAYAHQDLPFEQVVDALKPARSLGHSPIFQAMLSLNNTPANAELTLPGLTMRGIARENATTQFDLSLSLVEVEDSVFGSLDFATDLFDRSSMQSLLDSLQRLLAAMVADDRQRVSAIDILSEADARRMLVEWNRSEADFPLERTYAALFAEQAALHPDRIAAVCREESLSYRELDGRATRLAQALLDAGVASEQLVTLVGERSTTLLTMMLAVLKAGAAFLPLDVKHPAERLREIMAVSQSSVILESADCKAVADAMSEGVDVQPLRIVAEQHCLAGPVPPLAPRGTPDDLAYVIFTSGSTGKPKGAMVEQRGMLNHMLGKLLTMQVDEQDRLAQTASPAFDICVWQFLSAALVGATCDILPDEVVFDPPRLIETVERNGITLLQTVPSMMRSLLDAAGVAPGLARLRWLVPTGEALPLNVAQEWFERFPAIPLMNVYGPAECSDDVTFHALMRRPQDGSAIPIGRPTPNNRIYIVDRHLRPVPVGVVGEICVGGAGVGRGYLNNPEQTAAAFVAHPFSPGERFYRTGDLGRYRADGVIEFAGRGDYQVKLRGFRIELGEIEVKLCTCDGVRDAIVVAREDQPGDKRLVAYLVPRDGAEPTATQLRAQLQAMVADYMVPSAFVMLEAFPLTPNGKIDRKALPAPDQSALAQRHYEAPYGDIEVALAQIWQDLLGAQQVGRQDNFFELGGHSLLATQLVLRVRQVMALELPLMKVFQMPTLSALSEEISALAVGQFEASDVARIEAEMGDMSAAELQSWLDQN